MQKIFTISLNKPKLSNILNIKSLKCALKLGLFIKLQLRGYNVTFPAKYEDAFFATILPLLTQTIAIETSENDVFNDFEKNHNWPASRLLSE